MQKRFWNSFDDQEKQQSKKLLETANLDHTESYTFFSSLQLFYQRKFLYEINLNNSVAI